MLDNTSLKKPYVNEKSPYQLQGVDLSINDLNLKNKTFIIFIALR